MTTFLNTNMHLTISWGLPSSIIFRQNWTNPNGADLANVTRKPIMIGRIKRLNQHPEAIMLMVQQRMSIPLTIIKTHYMWNIASTKDSLLYGKYFIFVFQKYIMQIQCISFHLTSRFRYRSIDPWKSMWQIICQNMDKSES